MEVIFRAEVIIQSQRAKFISPSLDFFLASPEHFSKTSVFQLNKSFSRWLKMQILFADDDLVMKMEKNRERKKQAE